MRARISIAFLAPVLLLTPWAVAAQTAAPTATAPVPHGTLNLVAEAPAIQPHSDLWLAFQFTLEPGWHLYWSNPGDSGAAPRLNWRLPAGLNAGAISWPTPKRLPVSGMMDYGYTDNAVLLVPIHSAAGLTVGTTAELGVEVRVVVCRELCIPGRAQLALRLPIRTSLAGATARPLPQTANLFAAARSRLPRPVPSEWNIRVQETKSEFLLDIETGRSISRATFFPLVEQEIENTAPQPVEAKARGFQMRLRKADSLAHTVKRLRGVLVMDETAYALDAPLAAPGSASGGRSPLVRPASSGVRFGQTQ